MNLEIREESGIDCGEYALISIGYRVDGRIRVGPSGPYVGGRSDVIPVSVPYLKDYDTLPGCHPSSWRDRFETSRWGILTAWQDGERVGGIVIVYGSDEVGMLDGRDDLALLWDLRVQPKARRTGVGTRLLAAAMSWAQQRGCRELKVETQDINVAAYRFYARHGFELRSVAPRAYPDLPEEIELLWYKPLARQPD